MVVRFSLVRADTMNLTQWREGAKGAKMGLLHCAVIPVLYPVIPAKAGIQMTAAKPVARSQD